MRRLAIVAGMLVFAGCGSGEKKEVKTQRQASDPQLIKRWIRDLNGGHYARAASYFARDAIVQQVVVSRLPTAKAAEAFNRSLPCRADVTSIKREGATTLASFRLRRGPGGPCKGAARVRFKIKRGKFTEWRQLGNEPAPSGQTI